MIVPKLTFMLAANGHPLDWNNVFIFLIAALAAWNAFRSSRRDKEQHSQKEKVDEVAKKTEALVSKTDVIHTLADGSLSRATAALALANETIKRQQEIIFIHAEAKKVADTVAEKAAAVVADEKKQTARIQLPEAAPVKVEVFNTHVNPAPVEHGLDIPGGDKFPPSYGGG